jgi:GNAT superfamily N-acetyltransferase
MTAIDERPQWAAAEAANRAELLAYAGTGACLESYRAANIAWVITGVPHDDYNGVIWARLIDDEAEQLPSILVERFRMHQLPSCWHLDAGTQPADLCDRLERLGCRPVEPAIGTAARIVDVTRNMRTLPQLTIERVTTTEELETWMDVFTAVSGEPRSPRDTLYVSLGLKRLEPLRHYLARLDGRPVGVSQLFLGQQVAGVYSVAVRPDYRRLGIGTALVQQSLAEARTLGYDVAVADPAADTLPFVTALGLEAFASPYPRYRLWP